MKEQILEMIQTQPEDTDLPVAVAFLPDRRETRQKLPGHTGPDECDRHCREQCRDALSAGQSGVFQIEAACFQRVVDWNYARQETPCGCESQSRTFQT